MNDSNEHTKETIDIDTQCITVISQVESFTKQNSSEFSGEASVPILAKIPVVLADINIIFNLEANITLDRLARELKRIKKNVFLTQSRIIPFSKDNEPKTGILYIKGFIKNNIEYIPEKYNIDISKNNSVNLRYCIVETPFELNTKITFTRAPIFNENSTENELDFCNYKISEDNTYSDKVIECSLCDESLLFIEIFNEKPYVELIRADIIEVDCNKGSILKNISNSEEIVSNITEKSVVNLTLKVLQRQEVSISTI